MKWLIQEFLNQNENVERMRKALELQGTDYLLVRLNKDASLTVLDIETRLPLDDTEDVLWEFLHDGSITGYGSKSFDKALRQLQIEPGSFSNEEFEMEEIQKRVGDELLNQEFIIGELQELHPTWKHFFIRPTGNTKLFGGMTVTQKEFQEWKERENHKDSPYIGQTLMISETKEISGEYRFFVIGTKVVTGSSYRVDGELNTSLFPSNDVWNYAQKMVDRFRIADVFVIDVAETNEGLCIVEYNNFNTSGLYACDENLIVRHLNQMFQ